MASKTNEEIMDLSVCSICFKKYRTPRILPCSHVFCHECISSTIVSMCQSKEAPVGFSCPLCREFVPSSAAENSPEKWADSLLECKILDTLNKEETNLCAACLRENEEKEATDICITCDESICGNCAKYHKRILTTRNHVLCTLTDPSLAKQFLNLSLKIANCPAQPDKEIELQCNDHKIACCSFCASTEHRKCADVKIIKSCVQEIKKEGDVQKLKQKIMEFEQTLVKIKKKQEDNIAALDVASDRITDETTQIRKDINERFDKLEKEHLDEIGQMTKNSKIILNKTIDSLSDRIEFSKHCVKILQDIECKTDSCFLKEYQETKDRFNALERQTMKLKEHEIKLESNLSLKLSHVAKLSKLSKNKVTHLQKELATGMLGLETEDTAGIKSSNSELSTLEKDTKKPSHVHNILRIENKTELVSPEESTLLRKARLPGAETKPAWTGRPVLDEVDDSMSESKDTDEYAPCAGPALNKCKMKGQTAKKRGSFTLKTGHRTDRKIQPEYASNMDLKYRYLIVRRGTLYTT